LTIKNSFAQVVCAVKFDYIFTYKWVHFPPIGANIIPHYY